ncbi:hypothetical protein [Algibacter lectus]|uniref:hypothetical protein n=1 Tax=Algibacter lectus TaxID=221126 RepID=UPI0026EA7579|nr:hypothetical protein [Algibacter lectus]MDO7137349.1 hypothetical protein [Algibacter lectus]
MKYRELGCFFVLSVIIVLLSLDVGMFWDNVLYGSKIGNHLIQNSLFRWDSIPVSIDNGHPPFLATLLASGWVLFGKSLSISHWMMLPFIFGLLYQLYYFVCFFVEGKYLKIAAFILVLADPTLLSQLVLISPEIFHLFFFFLALNSILRNNIFFKILGLSLLGIVTFRGMMLCFGVFLIDALIYTVIKKQKIQYFFSKEVLLTYSVAATPACLYVAWRYATKGWLISHPLQTWGNALEFSSILDFLRNFGRNILVLGYQFTDFGRIVLLLFIVGTFCIKRKTIDWKKYNYLLIISVFSTSVIYSTSLIIRNTMGHRYFVISYVALALLAFMLIMEYRAKKIIFSGMLVSLLLGNLIVYPDTFAQGWDASLAHLSYWPIRKEAINYMEEKGIPIGKTASFFPNSTSIDNIDLNGDIRAFEGYSGDETYVFYSNVYNLSDEELQELQENYYTLKLFKKNNVRIEIMMKIAR